jgi:ribosomal protein S30
MGKVHMMMSRSGKVRRMTPRVEPKDKPVKEPVGRKKKRQQYEKKLKSENKDEGKIFEEDNADDEYYYDYEDKCVDKEISVKDKLADGEKDIECNNIIFKESELKDKFS